MKVKSYIQRGNSFPIIVESEGSEYFVKLRAGMSGQFGLASEWIGNQLGRQLGLKTQQPIWMELTESIQMEHLYIEVKELIQKSLGLNIAFKYQEEARAIKMDELLQLNKQETIELYLFDLMMINIDRTAANTNLMKVREEVLSVDYESCLLLQDLMGRKNLLENDRILHCLKNNPLYQEIEETSIDQFLEKTEKISFPKIISAIPLKVLNKENRFLITKGIKEKIKNQWSLKSVIRSLKNIQTESPADRKNRINQNQENFRNRFNKSTTPKKK